VFPKNRRKNLKKLQKKFIIGVFISVHFGSKKFNDAFGTWLKSFRGTRYRVLPMSL
jgi:hypothetical protein